MRIRNFILAAVIGLAGCERAAKVTVDRGEEKNKITPAATGEVTVVSNLLGPLPENIKNVYLSPDRRHVAHRVAVGSKFQMVLDGVPHEASEYVSETPVFSSDSAHFAYVTREGAVLDGKLVIEGSDFDPVFSPDGKHIAFHLYNRVVLDGKAGKSYEYVDKITFSADSKHLAYEAHRKNEKDHLVERLVVVDGIEGEEMFDFIRLIAISSDGRHVAYGGNRFATLTGEKSYLVLDGKPAERSSEIVWAVFSSDGKHLATMSSFNGGSVEVDGKVLPSCGRVEQEDVAFGPKSNDVICRGDNAAYVNGKMFRGMQFVFSPDGDHLAFLGNVQQETPDCLVLDGKVGPAIGTGGLFGTIRFSPDSRRVAYVATDENTYSVVADGVAGPAFEKISSPPVFSNDSRHLSYTARQGDKCLLVIDGKVEREFVTHGELYSGASPICPDGRHISWVEHAEKKWRVVVDGQPGPWVDWIEKFEGKSPEFAADGTIGYVAINEKKIFRIVHRTVQ